MEQENINFNKKSQNLQQAHRSSTIELAKKLGIVTEKRDNNSKDDLLRLEAILYNKREKEKKRSNKKRKKYLTEDDISYLTKIILDVKNKDILQQLLENVETTQLSTKAKDILNYVDSKKESVELDSNKFSNPYKVDLGPIELLNDNKDIKDAEKLDLTIKKDTEEIKDAKKEYSESKEEKDANELLKLILEDTHKPSKTTDAKEINQNIDPIKIEDEAEDIKIDKFYIVNEDEDEDKSNNIISVTQEDIDSYLSKQVTREKSTKEQVSQESAKTYFVYEDVSGISTAIKAILYPIFILLPTAFLAWLTNNLKVDKSYLNLIEPYKNRVLSFFNSNNIDMKIVTYILLATTLLLALILITSFLRRIIMHFKKSRVLTDSRLTYAPSKKRVIFTYLKTLLLTTIATALFVATAYAILHFIQLNELNIQNSLNSSLEWIKNLLNRYIK